MLLSTSIRWAAANVFYVLWYSFLFLLQFKSHLLIFFVLIIILDKNQGNFIKALPTNNYRVICLNNFKTLGLKFKTLGFRFKTLTHFNLTCIKNVKYRPLSIHECLCMFTCVCVSIYHYINLSIFSFPIHQKRFLSSLCHYAFLVFSSII